MANIKGKPSIYPNVSILCGSSFNNLFRATNINIKQKK